MNFSRLSIIVIVVTLCAAFVHPHMASAKTHHKKHHGRHASLTVPNPSYADIVIEADTGRILHETNSHALRHPASLTKMMTLYLTFQALDAGKLSLNQYLPISSNAAQQSPSKLGLRAGNRIKVEDAILGLVTESANDAAVVLGEWLGGSEAGFARMMTRQAKDLGMENTRFKNPSGLPDPEQVTTARDMAMLGHALIYHFAKYYPYFSHESFTYAGITHANHNHLMSRYDGMDGIKTGYIRASGFNLVASAKRDGTRLVAVIFGGRSARSRDNQMAQLLDTAFESVGKPAPAMVVAKAELPEPQGDAELSETGMDAADVDLPAKKDTVFKKPAPTLVKRVEPKPAPVKTAKTMRPTEKPALAKTTLIKTATKATASQSGNEWGVQIGAYSEAELGRMALEDTVRTMPQLLGNATPMLDKVGAKGGTLYRARLMSLNQDMAETVCATMLENGQSCLMVSP